MCVCVLCMYTYVCIYIPTYSTKTMSTVDFKKLMTGIFRTQSVTFS